MTSRGRNLALGLVALLALPLATAARAPSGSEQGKTAAQIAEASETAMRDVKSFHVVGVEHINGTSFSLSVSPKGGGGTVSVPGATLDLVVSAGFVYIKADEQSWLKLTGSQSTAQLVANRWIKAPVSNADFSGFADLTISGDFISGSVGVGTGLTKAPGTTTWDGTKAIVLSDQSGDKLYVAATGTPYILHVQAKGSEGYLTFTDFGDAPIPAAPKNAIALPGT